MAKAANGSIQRHGKNNLLPVPEYSHIKPRELIDQAGGIDRICTIFRAPEELVYRWHTGQTDPAPPIWIALFWQSSHGFQAAFSASHWTHSYNAFLAREARARVELLEAALHQVGVTVPGRLTTPEETLLAGPTEGHWLNDLPAMRAKLKATVADLPAINAPSTTAAPLSRPSEPLFAQGYAHPHPEANASPERP